MCAENTWRRLTIEQKKTQIDSFRRNTIECC